MATENTKEEVEIEEVITEFQPHFEYDDWKKDGKPKGTEGKDPYIAKGFDMFATKGAFYIVRSDLDRPIYMRIESLHNPKNKGKIYDLPESFQNGDHYFGDSGNKFVIRGKTIHKAPDMSTDVQIPVNPSELDAPVSGNSTLAEESSGGMHYINFKGTPYKIGHNKVYAYNSFEKGTLKNTTALHKKLQDGICYFALADYIYVVKLLDIGAGVRALCYYQVKSFTNDPGDNYQTINKSIQAFMPGGYTFNNPATPVWDNIGSIKNQSSVEAEYELEFKYSHGSSKSSLYSIEHHWELEITEEAEAGVLIAKAGVSATQKYGGSRTWTDTSEWNESSEETVSFKVNLKPGQGWALWQPSIKLGGQKTLIQGKNVVATDGNAPKDEPWQ